MSNPDAVAALQDAVGRLNETLDAMIESCDSDAEALVRLFADLQGARKTLQMLESGAERAATRAMDEDVMEGPGLRAVRRFGRKRTEWQHDVWRGAVRQRVMEDTGLADAEGVLTAEGEVLPSQVLWEALQGVQDVFGAVAPKTTALKALGLRADDYCHSEPGRTTLQVDVTED